MSGLSIDDLTYAWAERQKLFRGGGGRVLWIATTKKNWDIAKSEHLRNWEKVQEGAGVKVNYQPVEDHLQPVRDFGGSRRIDNRHGSTTLKETVEFSKEITESIEVTITGGFKLGYEVSGKLELPFVASGGFKQSGEVNFSAGRKSLESAKRIYKYTVPVEVPSTHYADVLMHVDMRQYKVPFTATIPLHGGVAVQFEKNIPISDSDPHHRLWWVSVDKLIRDLQAFNYTPKIVEQVGVVDISGYSIAPKGVIASTEGVLTAAFGARSETIVREYDARGKLIGSPNQYVDDVGTSIGAE
ncbi:ETX/MTX2 family pore-forming toxin [Nocardiopsis ansamitocini]|uniref:Uncharacterized protein n=1 Tax=Nocardiopsis ansamitocini TaxID=1670832 RepID=A0A9W6UJ52_9ACTN|nr:ETX/MTX2 family pore-forming toxin [Nocardiopsis ansamitocini]GLU48377.1 hypothetical protein Nans01_27280 [Nocardiopsis ansamitocini]